MKIILLHGLYMHNVVMLPLEKRLERAGHEVLNLGYRTVAPDLEEMFKAIDAYIDGDDVAIVAHSMGGVMARTYLECQSEMSHHVKTVVTLGTPHNGSQVAAFFKNIGVGDVMFDQATKYLLPDEIPSWSSKAALYSLAGDLSIGPATILLHGQPSDGTVLLEETKIEGMTSHEIFPLTHTSLIFSERVSDRVIEILE
ncbi:alpha/beta fold hydrolase [Enterovibrio sp. ZSDZ42]|uniref:Alpha/beta fold hydrolase n=1 Tax=Enterovibrio gelatinilyticus TaxID=2899819 RepID=A0ABT5QZN9_9GAMM|nr:alpha/beta fold hydrolase [Enterovibrio sp. ZSDZ42]MDD1793090.1 alpha/beta fold hydrolase [Enterovibrio sp. ZSDZ42]